jgi:hypothetical protein
MTLMFDFLTVDAHNPRALARFWEQALPDYAILDDPDEDPSDDDEEVGLLPTTRRGPKILFIKVPDDRKVKNRLHFDLRPSDGSKEDEVARLEALGATKVDIGQGDDVTWTVMADPEGNEFCVLRVLSDEEKEKYAAWTW